MFNRAVSLVCFQTFPLFPVTHTSAPLPMHRPQAHARHADIPCFIFVKFYRSYLATDGARLTAEDLTRFFKVWTMRPLITRFTPPAEST